MRILIITHPRSGGKSLLDWVSKETGFYGHHDPILDDEKILHSVLNDDDIVVKLFPFNLSQKNIDVNQFAKSFDKVICHLRGNEMDVAISLTYGNENNRENINNWHKTYQVDDNWVKNNQDKINNYLGYVSNLHNYIKNIDVQCLITTYDGIYENKTDIDKLINFLEIKKPQHLDRLDKRHRLRNGNVGDSDYKVNRPLI